MTAFALMRFGFFRTVVYGFAAHWMTRAEYER